MIRFWLSDEAWTAIEPHLPMNQSGAKRVDDRRVIWGILQRAPSAGSGMDPIAGIIGACVIASWSYGLIRDTGAILLDMLPGDRTAERLRHIIEATGDRVLDLHVWRLDPGHLGAIIAVATAHDRDAAFYRGRLTTRPALSHLTIEVNRVAA